jgi:hypothetical protein
MNTTVVGATVLVARELHPRLAHGLSEILHSGSTDETQLALDNESTAQHGNESNECDKEVNLQTGNYPNERNNHAEQSPPHTAGRMAVQPRRRHGMSEFFISL